MVERANPAVRHLIEELIRVGNERSQAEEERDRAQGELYQLRSRVAELERKYEPKPLTYWRQVQMNEHGVPLDPKALEWMREAIEKSQSQAEVK